MHKAKTHGHAEMTKEDVQLLDMLVRQQKEQNTCVDSDSQGSANTNLNIRENNKFTNKPSFIQKNQKRSDNVLDQVNITDESDDSDDIKRQERIEHRNSSLKDDGNIEKYKSKPKYLIEKEERERDDAEFNKSEDTKRRRDRKNNFKQKDFRKDKNLSDDEANLPSLDDLGIKVEEKNNQIIFDLNNKKKVEVKNFRGSVLIDLREYFYKENQCLPTKKGLSITKDIWDKFKAIIPHVDAAIKKICCDEDQ